MSVVKGPLEEPTQLRERLALTTCGLQAEQDLATDMLAQLAARAAALAHANEQKRVRIDEIMTVCLCTCVILASGSRCFFCSPPNLFFLLKIK